VTRRVKRIQNLETHFDSEKKGGRVVYKALADRVVAGLAERKVGDLLKTLLSPHKSVVGNTAQKIGGDHSEDDNEGDAGTRDASPGIGGLLLAGGAGLPVEEIVAVVLARQEPRGIVAVGVAHKVNVTADPVAAAAGANVSVGVPHHDVPVHGYQASNVAQGAAGGLTGLDLADRGAGAAWVVG